MALEQEPVLDFMVVRSPESVEPVVRRSCYVHDEAVVFKDQGVVAFVAEDLHTEASTSGIGKLVFQRVFCHPDGEDDSTATRITDLLGELLSRLPQYGTCAASGQSPGPADPLLPLEELEQRTYVRNGARYVLLPDRPEHLPGNHPLLACLGRALAVAREEQAAAQWDTARLVQRIEAAIGAGKSGLRNVVLTKDGAHSDLYRSARRALFDALYLLYVMRRKVAVNMEHIIDGLRVLHLLEALVVDGIYTKARGGKAPATGDQALLTALAAFHPGLRDWDGKTPVPGFPLVAGKAALSSFLTASPVVHPIFARLFWYTKPFNEVRPIGVGDLKVVRQWLTAYVPGEISHIHNVMLGERKVRDHRRLEKNEETFSFSDSSSEESLRDTQTTQRFEVKAEAEKVVKTALGVTANANVSYNGGTVVASLGAGFSYNRSSDDTHKTAQNFAREVVDKAVDRVTMQTSAQRSSSRQYETEEKNQQVFSNVGGKAHVSGMYRWVDKEYTAQVYTYGKRLMFELLVPEPAAFWAESKLRGYEAELDVPQPPEKPTYAELVMPVVKDPLDREEFTRLGQLYDFTGLVFPEPRTATLVNRENGQARFEETGLSADDLWVTKTYACRLDRGTDHVISALRVAGKVEYRDATEEGKTPADSDRNLFALTANGAVLFDKDDSGTSFRPFWPMEPIVVNGGPQLDSDDVTFTIGGQEVTTWRLTVDAVLTPGPRLLSTLRTQVVQRIQKAETDQLKAANRQLELAYETELATYRNRLSELEAVTVASVLQGRASAANRAVMDEEIKKHCLTLLAKEFDEDSSDDVLQDGDAMGLRVTPMDRTQFKVKPPHVGFVHDSPDMKVPAIDIEATRTKATLVQFLEQAFEWHHISYLLYPYFWAELPRWVELMNRSDDADSDFTAFLRAGMARVLIAVTPAYEDAVLHFLATREPWTGGPSPVIGDPLFLPLHAELRKQTDDRLGGVPDGDPWTFTVPTSLVYLHGSGDELPDVEAEREAREKAKKEQGEGGNP